MTKPNVPTNNHQNDNTNTSDGDNAVVVAASVVDPSFKNNDETKKRRALVQKAMWSEARTEAFRLSIGALALVASSGINQRVPKLLGRLMESPVTTNTANDNKQRITTTTTTATTTSDSYYFVMQIVWLGTLGGMSSFVRTYMMASSQERIATRLRSKAFATLLLRHDLEWFQSTPVVIQSTQKDDTNNNNNNNNNINNQILEETDSSNESPSPSSSSKAKSSTTITSTGMTPAAIGVILKDDVDTVAQTMTTTIANIIRSSSSCIFGTYSMLSINPQLVGISLLVAPLVGAIALASRKYISKIKAQQQQATMDAASFVQERLEHIYLVQSSNRQDDEIRQYQDVQSSLLRISHRVALANGWSMGIMFSLGTSALCGILLQGRRAVQANKMTSGQLTSFGTYTFLLALGTAGLVRSISEYRNGLQSAMRLYTLIIMEPTTSATECTNHPTLPPTKSQVVQKETVQSLSVDTVDFSYQSRPSRQVLHQVSFQLSRGEVVALVGRNGSGKSTLASLLTGMYHPSNGTIDIQSNDNNNTSSKRTSLDDIDRHCQAQLVQIVPQQPVLFNMSVLENVRYGRPDATEEQVLDALASVHAKDFVLDDLEGQLQYQVGRNGCRLSGGQRQKIALARAFLADPVFLILDEPNAAMDTEAELALNDTLQACRQANRGLLIITHRAKTLDVVDRIVVLKDGHVVEEGTLTELQRRHGNEFVELMPELE
ncbi:efflux ABC transporter permease/ATP-binding protein [Nitzschia inconspicua]|uniref:Efflux ABC transporter permease/ATP-binding protein n=1 Tax=Nitzschia inconspicua TaxID=303405 RepID=A0A9K3M3Q8_9STRA|nr:efflux ABC transporter permease/ATP-binding protein [Nitzschia inconspicua]